MLILNRKENETVCIDGRVIIQVVKTSPTSVTLGFEAPREVSIVRGEVLAKREETITDVDN